MLYLTRKYGQTVVIGDDVRVTVLPSPGNSNQVRLAFDAPESIRIHREEVWMAIQREQEIADAERRVT